MIEFKNVCFSYGETPVINNLSFKIKDGQNMLITGPSGCGKTTVLRLILGLIEPDSGNLTAPDNISVVFQENRLIQKLSAYKNITLPLNREQIPLADSLIDELNLSEIKSKRPASLSGGMKRRVAIIRAVSFGGDMLLLDEPFNGIDKQNKILVANMINREYTDKGKTVIIISHDTTDAKLFGADILTLKKAEN